MKIIKVIVDELPKSASRCDASTVTWEPLRDLERVACQFRRDTWLMTIQALTTTRCPDCPLALEHDARIADERKVSIEQIMALKKLARY